ncbi:MAG: endonuclease III [Chloroflexi bacterium]|nr:endonuclease III [Chloroflexota bacterium]
MCGVALPSDTSEAALKAKALGVNRRLEAAYGHKPWRPRRDALRELISTILSHRTKSATEWAAMDRLWQKYGSWEGIRDAPVEGIVEAIYSVTWAERKGLSIKRVLQIISERRTGELNIDFLADLPVEEGLEWLTSLPGVGIKTASLVLLFNFHKTILPVDTHLHRVSMRLGLIGPKVTPEQAHEILAHLLPPDPDIYWNYHVNMLQHGREICIWSRPRCEKCVLTGICDYYHDVRLKGKG